MTTFSGHLTDAQAQRIVDDALLDQEREMVVAHEAGCPDCQALVVSYRDLGDALDGLELPDIASDFTAGVLAAIDERERAAARERRVAAAITLAGVAGLALAVGLSVGQWGDAIVRALDLLAAAGQAARTSLDVAAPILSALRLPIGFFCAVVAAPILLALSRLMPAAQTETA